MTLERKHIEAETQTSKGIKGRLKLFGRLVQSAVSLRDEAAAKSPVIPYLGYLDISQDMNEQSEKS